MVDHDPQQQIKQLVMPAGSVMFFADGALVHGTTPWLNPIPRRTILNKYSSRSFNRSGGELVAPENRWGEEVVEGKTHDHSRHLGCILPRVPATILICCGQG